MISDTEVTSLCALSSSLLLKLDYTQGLSLHPLQHLLPRHGVYLQAQKVLSRTTQTLLAAA